MFGLNNLKNRIGITEKTVERPVKDFKTAVQRLGREINYSSGSYLKISSSSMNACY
jgi:hypothetical protein